MTDLAQTLAATLNAPVQQLIALGSSSAGQLYRVRSTAGEFALKWADQPTPGALATEARGLRLLAATSTIRVPHVHALHDPSVADDSGPAYLLIAWLEGAGAAPDMAALEH